MPYNLLIIPLLAGYCLLHQINYTRFRSQRLDGYRLLIESALAGLALSVFARLMIVPLANSLMWAGELRWWWQHNIIEIPYSGTAMGALVVGLLAPAPINLLHPEKQAKNKAIERHGTALIKLFQSSVVRHRPVEITLSNRKYYVGYVTQSPNLDPAERYFRLVPIISGCRTGDDLSVKHIVSYAPIYRQSEYDDNFQLGPSRDLNDFAVTLPIADVVIARLFDRTAWDQFARQSQLAHKRRTPRG